MAGKDYSAKDITVLEGLEPVRKKPGMYIGATDMFGVYQIAKEIIDNAIDEHLAGHNNVVGVMVDDKSHEVTIWDEGRGIPVEPHPKTKKSTLETIFTTLHAGGKIDKNDAYKASRGTHGVGASVTNALSEHFTVSTKRKGKWYGQTYRRGKPKGSVKKTSAPVLPTGKAESGTVITYKPDSEIFKKIVTNSEMIQRLLDLAAYLHPGLKLYLYPNGPKSKREKFYQPKGPKALIQKMMEDTKSEPIGRQVFYVQDGAIELAMQWSSYDEDNVKSYVCGSPTSDGGTHVVGLLKALGEAIRPYKGKKEFRGEDLRIGLQCVLNVNMSAPSFEGQTKNKLASKEVTDWVYQATLKPLIRYFKENKSMVKTIVARAVEIRAAVQDFQFNKKVAAQLKQTRKGKLQLPVKLKACLECKPGEREIFLVEGDSAGGTADAARNKKYQEVLKLRGKILNAYKDKSGKVLNSDEVLNILQSIGYDPTKPDPIKNLRIAKPNGKIIVLADPDVDGAHINVLVLSLLRKMIPRLFDEGFVYLVDSPLYNVQHKGQRIFAKSLKGLMKKVPNLNPEMVQRIKGWGEVQAPVLERAAFDPETRRLIQIRQSSGLDYKKFVGIVGEDVAARRQMIGI